MSISEWAIKQLNRVVTELPVIFLPLSYSHTVISSRSLLLSLSPLSSLLLSALIWLSLPSLLLLLLLKSLFLLSYNPLDIFSISYSHFFSALPSLLLLVHHQFLHFYSHLLSFFICSFSITLYNFYNYITNTNIAISITISTSTMQCFSAWFGITWHGLVKNLAATLRDLNVTGAGFSSIMISNQFSDLIVKYHLKNID